jgi:hypothetical protein
MKNRWRREPRSILSRQQPKELLARQRFDDEGSSRKLRLILWNIFTGNIPYKDIFKYSLDIRLQISLLFHTIRIPYKKIKNAIKGMI